MPTLFDTLPQPEPSSLVGFSQNRLVRDAESRNEQSLSAALADSHARFVLFSQGRILINETSPDESHILVSAKEGEIFGANRDEAILLGSDENGPILAANAGFDPEALAPPFQAVDIRTLLYWTTIGDDQTSIAAHASCLLSWNDTNRYCGKCGTKSNAAIGGYRRECPSCGHQVFPRTDPVVIMLAVDGDHCLLGRSPHFPENWYSTLAGFVEPGETIEDAVRREVVEESGISVGRVRYHASQPWPFPHSLMIGVHCEALNHDIRMDEDELEDCRWFSREDVKQMIAETHPHGFRCPPTKAIAHNLIAAWVNETL